MTVYRNVPLTDLPENHYKVVYVDPPWKYLTWSAKGLGKSPDQHYKTMTLRQLMDLPVRSVCAKDVVLLVWVIDTHLEIALKLIQHWGFRYKTVGFYWAKTTKDGKGFPIGTGFWTRANPEHVYECVPTCRYCNDSGWFYGDPELGPCGCPATEALEDADGDQEVVRCLLASKGHPKRVGRAVPRLLVSPKREHSRKPDDVYERIEALVDGPYLEMFSRSDREGWDCWGLEAGMFSGRQLPEVEEDYMALLG